MIIKRWEFDKFLNFIISARSEYIIIKQLNEIFEVCKQILIFENRTNKKII